MKRYFKNLLLYGIVPILFMVIIGLLYVNRDPYLDLRDYPNYSWRYRFQTLGDLSTKKLLHNKQPYNSFILGSSRGSSIYACYLQQKIKNSHFYLYNNWNETIGGIYAKLHLLDSLGYAINNVLIYIDADETFADDGDCKIYDHYLLSHSSKFDYYCDHFKYFLSQLNINKFKVLLGMPNELDVNWLSDPITNDTKHTCSDSVIKSYANSYITDSYKHVVDSLSEKGFYYTRSSTQQYHSNQISQHELDILQQIKAMLQKHHTKYYIVNTPLYDQLKLSVADAVLLQQLFSNHYYDFSGINNITNNKYNYPDRLHFKEYISKIIIDSVVKE